MKYLIRISETNKYYKRHKIIILLLMMQYLFNIKNLNYFTYVNML